MIKLEHTDVVGWEHAIRGMRNPMNSWDKSDSQVKNYVLEGEEVQPGVTATQWLPVKPYAVIGPNDHKLMMNLRNGGTDHRKFMRMIIVYVDITAPLYWWKEFDTYKVGTVANSCSTMHKIHDKEFTLEDFSHEKLVNTALEDLGFDIGKLNAYRKNFIETKDKTWWEQMIQRLPSSYNQKRTVMLNYEVLANIYKSRKNHKLDEWRELCKWIESLPYSEIITGESGNETVDS